MASSDFKASEAQPDLEKQPLFSDKNQEQKTFGSVEESGKQNAAEAKNQDERADHDEWDSTRYDISQMTSWRVFTMTKGAVFASPTIWKCMTFASILALCVAAGILLSGNATWINPERLQKIGTFLNVFVGLLVGFFLSSSTNRWYSCVNAFLQLLDAVRNMHMQMIALGVDRERCELLSRYGILSAWLLHLSLNNSKQKSGSDKKLEVESSQREKAWALLEQVRPHLVKPFEKEQLLRHQESYAFLWSWVASLIGRMSQDGEIPPMASPTYGRILEIVETAYGSIRNVRVLHLVKNPFIYVHTLAILVHVNHILNAISFGLVMGITTQVVVGKAENKLSDLPHLVGCVFMQFCVSMVVPFLYLALLNVSVCISQPFTYQDTKIPTLQFIQNLEEDIANATVMADNTKWEKPRFKK
jgi:predicted membrane chloride channel (bestrophin family)